MMAARTRDPAALDKPHAGRLTPLRSQEDFFKGDMV